MDTSAAIEQREDASASSVFDLVFPADLVPKQVLAWVHALGGLLVSGPRRLFGVRSLALELWATDKGLSHRLAAPKEHAEYLANQLRTHLPGIRVTPVASEPRQAWTLAVELGLRRHIQTLHIPDPTSVSTSVLAGLREVGRGEAVLLQWVLTPALHERPPAQTRSTSGSGLRLFGGTNVVIPRQANDRILDQRQKLEAPNVLAVLRIGVTAASEVRARHLIGSVMSVLGSTRSSRNSFHRRPVRQSLVQRRITARSVPTLFPIQLTEAELVALLGWPIGAPHVAGLPQSRSRHLPPSGAIPRRGLVVARANFPGAERPLALSPVDACKHLHIVGPTGVGKTVLAGNLVRQAIEDGAGVIVMERKGDLFRMALDAVPERRLDDVIVLDVGDSHPVGYNLLSEGNARVAVEELCQLFEFLYPDMRRGIWARAALHRALSTLITRPGTAFIDLVPLLSPNARSEVEQQWRDELIAEVKDPELARFWRRFDDLSPAQQENYAAPILDRVWQLNERPEIRNVIGQSESSFSMRGVIRSRKILLINLAGLGVETGRLAGTLLLNAIWSAVRSGAANPVRPTYLFLDEFQDFLNLPVDAESLLVQARSFGLAMMLAHQHLDQLPEHIRSAVLANARSKVVFQTTFDDARVFAREFGRAVSDEDFMNLGAYEVLCRFAGEEGISAPVSGMTFPPAEAKGLAEKVRRRSRERYGRAAADIAADIARRRTPRTSPAPHKRPRLGGTTWE